MKKEKIKTYRLKINHCNYKKGNLVHWDDEQQKYHNHSLGVFRRRTLWSFLESYVIRHTEIFEPIKNKQSDKFLGTLIHKTGEKDIFI